MDNSRTKTSMLVSAKMNFHQKERMAIQLFGERESRPQEEDRDYYRHARKINYGLLDSNLESVSMEFRALISDFQPTDQMLTVNPKATQMYPSTCELKIVQSQHDFDLMMIDLWSQVEISVDLECHNRYLFRGSTALLQISSATCDYIICAYSNREDIIRKLTGIFQSVEIVKVFHAIDNDFLALRRDFDITLIAAVDTKEVYKLISREKQAISYEDLLRKLNLRSEIDGMPEKKIAQLSDWRVRPLPPGLVKYARHDSHGLLRAWNTLKIQLSENKTTLREGFHMTAALLVNLKYKPPKQEDPLKGLSTIQFPRDLDKRQATVKFIDLHRWRHQLGKMVDCSPALILSNKDIVKIIATNPQDSDEMQQILDSLFPPFMRGHQGKAFFRIYASGLWTEEVSHKCHNCFLLSHQAWACWKSKDRSAWKKYTQDPKNAATNNKQRERRMRKLEENRRKREM